MPIALDQNYDSTPAEERKPFTRPPSGGYILRVIEAKEAVSNNGNDMVVFSMDIHEGEHKDAFKRFPIKFYQLTGGEHLGRFKGIMEAFAKSNNPQKFQVVIQGGTFYPERMAGFLIGGCIRDEEYKKQDTGEIKVKSAIAYLCSVERVRNGEVEPMGLKLLEGRKPSGQATGNPPPHGDDDLPNW